MKAGNLSNRKETVLDLVKFVDKRVQVKLSGGRQGRRRIIAECTTFKKQIGLSCRIQVLTDSSSRNSSATKTQVTRKKALNIWIAGIYKSWLVEWRTPVVYYRINSLRLE